MQDLTPFQCEHEFFLVVLSYTVSVFGAYCALRLAAQISPDPKAPFWGWLIGSAVAMGGGAIWSMHFIAMIACRLPVVVSYDERLTVVSLLVAIVVTGIGLFIVARGRRVERLLLAGTLTGLGVAAMHYTGMSAMRLQARIVYRSGLVFLSVVIAVIAATAALWVAFHWRGHFQRLSASLVMGVAVCGMHYTGMAAATFLPIPIGTGLVAQTTLDPNDLAFMVFGLTLFVLALLSVGGNVAKGREAQETLRRAHSELEQQVTLRTAELAAVNESLKREIAEREGAHAERTRLATFAADIGAALTKADSLDKALRLCAEAMVQHMGAETASIWQYREREEVLDLVGSSWAHKPLFGPDARVPIGEFRVGRIASERKPALVDLTAEPEREDDRDWARREGMVAFAGYPMIVGDRLVGVMAMFSRKPFTPAVLDAMAAVADEIALGISRSVGAQALQLSEASTRALIDNMLTGVLTTDERSIIETVNPAAQKIFGYSAEELIGKNLTVLLPPQAAADPRTFLREARNRALGKVTEWEARRKNGEIFPMELALFDFQTPDGHRHSAGSVRDVSERREVERMKREFISTVSHELRTPLTSIRGSLGLIVGGVAGELPAESRALLDIAYKNTERLGRLVNDILDLEKIESGRMEFHLEFLEIGQLLRSALESNRGFAQQYEVRLDLVSEIPEAWVWVDRDRLIQVFTNLISNAVKFSPKEETVTLTLSRRGGRVRVAVADKGPGIPAEFRKKIFQRFQQADSSDTRQKGGTGLGLAITKSIVERLSGDVSFESEPGTGTTFLVDLPEQMAPEPVEAIEPRKADGPRILICEDDRDQASLLALILQKAGCHTEIARNAMEAKAFLEQRPFDAMTLDIVLPGQDGVSLIHELRSDERTRDLPIIVVSLDATQESSGLSGDAVGIVDWLEKPVNPERLLDAVRTAGRRANGRPRILHVEDDPDVIELLKSLLSGRAELHTARTYRDAALALREQSFDLAVLDIGLPDGSGLNLLPLLHRPPRPPVPVVIFSAYELSRDLARAIEAALVKSRTSNEEIVRTIESLVRLPAAGAA